MFIRFPEVEISRAAEALYPLADSEVVQGLARAEFASAADMRLTQKGRWLTTISDREGSSWQWGEKNGTPDQLIDRAILHGVHCAHKVQMQAELN